jgi:S1-C subfamily serine protease
MWFTMPGICIARHLGLKQNQGVLVLNVESGSPAAKAGLHEGDIFVNSEGNPLRAAVSANLRLDNQVLLQKSGVLLDAIF